MRRKNSLPSEGCIEKGEGLGWRGERVYAQKRQKGKWENNFEVREKGRRRGRGTEKRQGERRKREDKERGFSVSDRADLSFFASGGREMLRRERVSAKKATRD